MAGGFTLKLSGFDEVLKKLDVKGMEQSVTDELAAFGQDVVRDAKQLAPVDEGLLKNSINSDTQPLKVTISVNVDYAAYVEFGTRRFAAAYVASLPPDWQTFAAQYNGPGGGSFQEFVARLTAWVKRKGFAADVTAGGNRSKSAGSAAKEEQAAYRIALSILRNGIKPHPFLFPAFEKNRPLLIKNLQNLLK